MKFGSMEECLDYLPSKELQIVEQLRDLILQTIPDCKEKLTYNVPYYYRNRNICFLWPGSVFWGNKRSYEGVRLGFVNGHLLKDDMDYLEMGNRKYVAYRDLLSPEDIDIYALRHLLHQAYLIDQTKQKK